MSRLNSSMHNLLNTNILNILFNKKIYTITDFIQNDMKMLSELTNINYKNILDIRQTILNNYSVKVHNGESYYDYLLENSFLLKTHIENLDDLLEGGYQSGFIYELCGYPSSGKTQICLTMALNISQYNQKSVYYIDTKRDFSPKQLQNILENRKCGDDVVGHILNRILIKRVDNQFDLITALYNIKDEFKNGIHYPLIIIDSLPAIFYQIGDFTYTLNQMNYLVNILRYISIEFQVVILVTNILLKELTESEEIEKPALGAYWNRIPNVRIKVTKTDNNINLNVIKHCIREIGQNCDVVIDNNGVH